MTSIGFSRTVSGAAVAGLLAGGILVTPAPGGVAVSAPVTLTALTEDSSLMDQFGQLTGLTDLLHILDDPNGPLFPFAISVEMLLELFVVIPLTALVGLPLVLLTGGADGVQGVLSELSSLEAGVTATFDGLKDWYATHNAFTGALLDPPASGAAGLDLADPAAWVDALHGAGFDATGLDAGGVDIPSVDLDPGDLTL